MTGTERDLIGYALGLSEPGDALALHDRLLDDPARSLSVAGAATLAGLPSPGPQVRAPSLGAEPGQTLGPAEHPVPGDRMVLRVTPPVSAERLRLALFQKVDGNEILLFPRPGRPWPGLEVFRAEGPERLVDLVLEPPPGLHCYTLVLLPAELFREPWPADDPRWVHVREAARRGDLPSASAEIEVASAAGTASENAS
ncbi:MAG: hypothetical protein ABIO70_29360 [Pseudomonadota bacterium]